MGEELLSCGDLIADDKISEVCSVMLFTRNILRCYALGGGGRGEGGVYE